MVCLSIQTILGNVIFAYETIYDEINDPHQDSPQNVYSKSAYGAWSVDHPDGSTTIFARGEPPILPTPQGPGLVQGINGLWYDPNDLVEQDESDTSTGDNKTDTSSEAASSDTASDSSIDELVTTKPSYELKPDFNPYSVSDILEGISSKMAANRNDSTYDPSKIVIDFAKMNVPFQVWARSAEELDDSGNEIHRYIMTLINDVETEEDHNRLVYYICGIMTYNTVAIHAPTTLEDSDYLRNMFYESLPLIQDTWGPKIEDTVSMKDIYQKYLEQNENPLFAKKE